VVAAVPSRSAAHEAAPHRVRLPVAHSVTLVAILVTIGVASWTATRGLDRTDEGLYLNSIAHPTDDRSTILLFGYAYHPLFVLVGGNIALLRWASIVLSIGVVAAFAWVALGTRPLLGRQSPVEARTRLVASLGIGTCAVLPIVHAPATPNYNTLALQGLAVAGTGLLLAMTRPTRAGVVGAALVGIGGWLTFLAKPTSAAVLAILVAGAVIAVPGRWRRRSGVALAVLVVAAGLTLLLARTSPIDLLTILHNGLATSDALGGHENLLRWDPIPHRLSTTACLAGALVLAGSCLRIADRHSRWVYSSGLVALGVGIVLTVLLILGLAVITAATVKFWEARAGTLVFQCQSFGNCSTLSADAGRVGVALLFFAYGVGLAGAGLATVVATFRRRGDQTSPDRDRKAERRSGDETRGDGGDGYCRMPLRPPLHAAWARGPLVAFSLMLPAAYAFGTGINLWVAQGRAACFWLILLCTLLARPARTLWMAPIVASLSLIVALLAATAAAPYRYYPLSEARTPTQVGHGTLGLTAADHDRAVALVRLGRKLGVTEDTRVLDLTGDSPGSIFLLGGRAVGQAWILGGYHGSEPTAALALQHDRCNMRDALIFVADGAPRAIPSRVLASVGIDLSRDYLPAGQFERERGRWGKSPRTVDRVMVYRPRQSLVIDGCSR
jgi:hypothetical protein